METETTKEATVTTATSDRTWTYPSSSGGGTYTVLLRAADGRLSCNCRGWAVKRGPVRECKHTTKVKGLINATWRVIGDAEHLAGEVTAVPLGGREAIPHASGPASIEGLALACAAATYYRPMLAETIERGRSVDTFAAAAWALEEKFDGVRITARVTAAAVEAWSRPHPTNPGVGLSHALHPDLVARLALLPEGYYDGELVVPGGMSSDVGRLDNAGAQRLMLFDVCELLGHPVVSEPYDRRRQLLEELVPVLGAGVVQIAQSVPPSDAVLQAVWSAGGEGVMLKRRASLYQSGRRSDDWVKVKQLREGVFRITGWEVGKMGPKAVMLIEHVENGKTTKVASRDTTWRERAERGEIAVGTLIEVEYQQETTKSFRHPRAKRVVGED